MKEILRVWKYSLGSFSDSKTERYDNWIATIRTIIFVSVLVTNSVIVAGVIRHWNAPRSEVPEYRDDVPNVSDDTKCMIK